METLSTITYEVDERVATCLLTGIATDTLAFRTASTTPVT